MNTNPLEGEPQKAIMRVDRVVGTTAENAEHLLNAHHQEVEQTRLTNFENEREKSEDERRMFAWAAKNVNLLREKHGLEPIELDPKQVRIISGDHVKLGETISTGAGGYSTMVETAFITDAEELGREGIGRLDTIQHELIHAGQYQSLQVGKGNEFMDYREGVGVVARRPDDSGEYRVYLRSLNEAITEENSRRLTLDISSGDPELGHVVKKREAEFSEFMKFCENNPNHGYPKALLGGDVLHSEINPENGRPKVSPFSYYDERQAMWKLFDTIHEKNPAAFPGKSQGEAREEMFDMVTKASLDGNLLPFGRLMNDTFGRGTFREYGHLQTAQEIVNLIDSLDAVKKGTETEPISTTL